MRRKSIPSLTIVREEFEDLLRENFALRDKVQWLEADMQKTKQVDEMVWNFISQAAAIKTGSIYQKYNSNKVCDIIDA